MELQRCQIRDFKGLAVSGPQEKERESNPPTSSSNLLRERRSTTISKSRDTDADLRLAVAATAAHGAAARR